MIFDFRILTRKVLIFFLATYFFSACRETNKSPSATVHFTKQQRNASYSNPYLEIDSLVDGATLLKYSNPDSAIVLFDSTYKLSQASNYKWGMAQSLMGKGLVHYEKRDYPEAIEAVYAAKDYVSGSSQQAQWFFNTAVVFSNFENAQKQLNRYYDVLEELGKAEDTSSFLYTATIANIGLIWGRIQEVEKRDYYYQKALQLVLNHKQDNKAFFWKELQATLFNIKAAYCFEENNINEGLTWIDKSLAITDSLPFLRKRRNESFTMLSATYAKIGDSKKARQFVDSYIVLNQGGDVYTTQIMPNVIRSRIAFLENNPKEIIHYANLALDNAKKLGLDKSTRFKSLWEEKVNAEIQLKRYDSAIISYGKFVDFLRETYNNERANSNRTLDFIYRTTIKDKAIADNQLLIEKKNNQIYQQQIIIGLIAGGLLLALLLVYSFKKRQQSQKQLFELQRKSDEIKHLRSITAIEEVQKRKLGAELHDGINGSMAAIKMNLSTLRKTHPELNNTPIFLETQEMLKETTDEIRQTAHTLIPEMLLKNGLNQALIAHINRISNSLHFKIGYSFFMDEDKLSPLAHLTIYRIIQELLQNILKHAEATEASVQLLATKDKISMIVEDNGIGFDQNEVRNGIGLENVKVRVLSLQGELDIQSTIGKHTLIRISFDKQNLM